MEKQTQNKPDQGFGIASLVIGVFAFLFSFIPCVGVISILMGVLAVIFGAMSLSRAQGANAAKGSGIAGVVLGGVAMLIAIFWLVFLFGAKDRFKDTIENKLEQFQGWGDDFDNLEEELEGLEDLDELEKALDELEGVLDDVHVEVDVTIDDAVKVAKEAVREAQEEIDAAKLDIEETKRDKENE